MTESNTNNKISTVTKKTENKRKWWWCYFPTMNVYNTR